MTQRRRKARLKQIVIGRIQKKRQFERAQVQQGALGCVTDQKRSRRFGLRGACAIMPGQVIGKHDEGDSQMIQALVEYFALVFEAIGYTLRFDPRVYVEVILHPEGAAIIRGIVFLAGVSMLLGQSLMLFVNRVRRGRFLLSLVINGIVFLITYAVWGICVALIAWLMFDVTLAGLVIVVFLVGLSTAPLIFGFLILIPYMGPAIGKVLNVWQLLIMTAAVQFSFDVGFIQAAVCVGLSWLLMLVMSNTIGIPVVKLRNFVYRKVTGSDLDATTQDILLEYSGGQGLAEDATTEGHA